MADWRREHANAAERVFDEPVLQRCMQEFADNMGFKLEGLPKYGLHKVAAYAAQLARAHAMGIDPETLRG